MTSGDSETSNGSLGAVWMAGIYAAFWVTISHWPIHITRIPAPRLLDKVVHFTGYAILAGLLTAAVYARRRVPSRDSERPNASQQGGLRWWPIWAAVVLFGLLDELTQPLTGRDFDLWDLLADALGAAAGMMLVHGLFLLLAQRRMKRSID